MDKNTNSLNWFEIPVTDMDRAKNFYETIFDIKMEPFSMPQMKMVGFPAEMYNGRVHGALVQHEMYQPLDNGVLIYLNANPEIHVVADRIEAAGGKVVIPKTQITPEIGYMAVFIDSEGNRVALHAQN